MCMPKYITKNRETDANCHIEIAYEWQKAGRRKLLHSPLVYAAFEYRCAIERLIFELYDLMKEMRLSDEEADKLKKLRSLVSMVHGLAGGDKQKLKAALRFNAVYVSEMISPSSGLRMEVSEPDVGKLHGLWSNLSEYCHRQLMPAKTWESQEWVAQGYELLEQVREYIWSITVTKNFGIMAVSTMPQEAQELREKFIEGRIGEPSLKTSLRIMKPIIEARSMGRGQLDLCLREYLVNPDLDHH